MPTHAAEAIGALRLIQLVGLEIEKLTADYRTLLEQIEEYEGILADVEKVRPGKSAPRLIFRGRPEFVHLVRIGTGDGRSRTSCTGDFEPAGRRNGQG